MRPVEGGVEVVAVGEGAAGRPCGLPRAPSHRIAASSASASRSKPSAATTPPLPAGAFDLRTQVTFGGHGFVVTRIGEGIRVGGAVELGGPELPPNSGRKRC